jgi:hypothetical protein
LADHRDVGSAGERREAKGDVVGFVGIERYPVPAVTVDLDRRSTARRLQPLEQSSVAADRTGDQRCDDRDPAGIAHEPAQARGLPIAGCHSRLRPARGAAPLGESGEQDPQVRVDAGGARDRRIRVPVQDVLGDRDCGPEPVDRADPGRPGPEPRRPERQRLQVAAAGLGVERVERQ